jgi:hypothetical protein
MKPVCVALVVGVLVTSQVDATVLVSADLPELVADARAIVHGRVVATQPQVAEGSRTIETIVTVAADEYLKGDLGARVSLRVPGGQLGFRRSVVIGAPVFTPGDQVVLFLGGSGPSLPWIIGLNQGVYRVRGDRAGGRSIAKGRLLEELRVVEHDTGYVRSGVPRQALPLSVFKARVRALVREGDAR